MSSSATSGLVGEISQSPLSSTVSYFIFVLACPCWWLITCLL